MTISAPTCFLKIDVDTHRGLTEGMPRLLDLFDELGVKASFFVVMGPDNSGRAIFRVFTQRGFLQKMLRTGAPRLYGWRTILSGTLLPAKPVGSGSPDLLREAVRRGHEVSIHSWDHIQWHDRMHAMTLDEARTVFGRAAEAYRAIFGEPPVSSAAPGWQASCHSFRVMDDAGLVYHADTRGIAPYFPACGGVPFKALEIPTTLPTLDELLGTATERAITDRLVEDAARQSLCVFTGHTETEGLHYAGLLRDVIARLKDRGFGFSRGIDIARRLLERRQDIPVCEFYRGTMPHRGGFVTMQRLPAQAPA